MMQMGSADCANAYSKLMDVVTLQSKQDLAEHCLLTYVCRELTLGTSWRVSNGGPQDRNPQTKTNVHMLPHRASHGRIDKFLVIGRRCKLQRGPNLLSHLFLTFLDHLLVHGRPVFLSYSIFDLVPCLLQLVLLHVSLYVVPPSLFRSASAPSPRNL